MLGSFLVGATVGLIVGALGMLWASQRWEAVELAKAEAAEDAEISDEAIEVLPAGGDEADAVDDAWILDYESPMGKAAAARGMAIARLRCRQGMSACEAALLAGFTADGKARWLRIEDGAVLPTEETLRRMAVALSVPRSKLEPVDVE